MRIARIASLIVVATIIGNVTANGADKPKEPDFTAQCTDRSGTTFDVSNIVFNFGYSYTTLRWIGMTSRRKTRENNPRTFLPFSHHGFVATIPFEKISTVEFVDAPPKANSWKREPSIKLELRDGSTLAGGFGEYGEHSQQFRGDSEFGKFALDVGKVKKIQFQHKTGEQTKRTQADAGKKRSKYTITIQTWKDQTLTLSNGFVFKLDDGFRYHDVSTAFSLKVGESEQRVSFDKVKELAFTAEEKSEAKLTTVFGKTFPATVTGYGFYIGGNLDKFGAGWIDLKRVRSISVIK